jgi:hypothetical protein|tara:strand:+ start:33 stop:260 length:228 start_codon:yes stop_codon:yes gene_type:complete
MRNYNTSIGIVITDELVELLEETFPNHLPNTLVTEPEISKLIGQQQVISWLKDKQDELRQSNLEQEGQVIVRDTS